MPELPEVETSRRGIEPHLTGQTISDCIVRNPRLRWPVPPELSTLLCGETIDAVERRGKYLLLKTRKGHVILHLGMSGHVRIVDRQQAVEKHDHIDIILKSGECLRFTDPRRFGCCLWTETDPSQHALLKNLGPEPLSAEFNHDYLIKKAKNRRVAIKLFIMNSQVVVGVGNIYANEALFQSNIDPRRATNTLTVEEFSLLTKQIKKILRAAIKQGGTTLKDFRSSDGKPGYFQQTLNVYGRNGLACVNCTTPLTEIRLGQRSTVFCKNCQY